MILQRNILKVVSTVKSLKSSPLFKSVPNSYCVLRHNSDSAGKRFTDRHEWISVEKDLGVVGITNYAQEALGDVVFAQLPEPKATVKIGDECGALESVKAASEIYTPVSGTVVEKNKDVEDKPGLINSSCYEKGWLFKLKISKPEELEKLMDEKQYEEFLKSDHQEHGH